MVAHSPCTAGSAAMAAICDSKARARRRAAYSRNAIVTRRFQLPASSAGARVESSSTRAPGRATLRRTVLSFIDCCIAGTLSVTQNSTPEVSGIPRELVLPLKLRVARSPRERDDVADVLHPGEIHQHALKAHAEAGVRHAAEPAQIQVPPVVFFLQTVSRHVADAL